MEKNDRLECKHAQLLEPGYTQCLRQHKDSKINARLTAWRHTGLNYTVKTQPNSRVLLSFPVALLMKRKAEIHMYESIYA